MTVASPENVLIRINLVRTCGFHREESETRGHGIMALGTEDSVGSTQAKRHICSVAKPALLVAYQQIPMRSMAQWLGELTILAEDLRGQLPAPMWRLKPSLPSLTGSSMPSSDL